MGTTGNNNTHGWNGNRVILMGYTIKNGAFRDRISLLNIIVVYVPILTVGIILGFYVALRVIDTIMSTELHLTKPQAHELTQ